MSRRYGRVYPTSLGDMTLICSENAMVALCFGKHLPDGVEEKEHPLLARCHMQLCEYLKGARRGFDIPLAPEGTGFQKKVWEALKRIPYGETRSYGEIAAEIGSPHASRAVGMANHRNPLPILIPCHRVIGKSGALTGYAGGLEYKKTLLELEKNNG